jgi:MYXO-CTERM domain-containing protein
MSGVARAVVCDGTEVLCLNLTSQSEVTTAGGVVVGGNFNASGFEPANQGGIDFAFGPGTDFSWGKVEFDITGLVPTTLPELGGGKVSLFSVCGVAPEDNEYIGCQKMPFDYRDGNIFRYGMDDDGLADNWDAVVITGAGFNCYYSIDDPAWQPGETHHIIAEWDSSGLTFQIDGWQCTKPGNGDTFDPADKFFVVGNRCEHLGNQHPVARISNLRLWALSHNPNCTQPNMIEAVSLMPSGASGQGDVFQAVYRHCLGASEFRIVQIMVADEVSPTADSVGANYENGLFSLDGQTCTPGEAVTLSNTFGSLDCSRSSVSQSGDDVTVHWALDFDPQTFAGQHFIFFDAKGGPGNPEPRLDWTQMGTYTVVASQEDAGVTDPDGGSAGDGGQPQPDAAQSPDGGSGNQGSGDVSGGCGCRLGDAESGHPTGAFVILALLGLLVLSRRRRKSVP